MRPHKCQGLGSTNALGLERFEDEGGGSSSSRSLAVFAFLSEAEDLSRRSTREFRCSKVPTGQILSMCKSAIGPVPGIASGMDGCAG